MKNAFNAAVSCVKTAYKELADRVRPTKAQLIVGLPVYLAFNAIIFGGVESNHDDMLQTSFNMAVKDHKPVWTTAVAAYQGNDFCASNAASFATTQVLQSHTLEEIKSMAMEDFFAKAAPILMQELHRIPGCENTTVERLVYQTGEISAAPALESPSIGLD